jgi:excisionase family DNA binding protein
LKEFKPDSSLDTLMTSNEVADYFSTTLPTIWSWAKAGILKQYKIGNKVFLKKSEVKAALIPQTFLHRKRLKELIKPKS